MPFDNPESDMEIDCRSCCGEGCDDCSFTGSEIISELEYKRMMRNLVIEESLANEIKEEGDN